MCVERGIEGKKRETERARENESSSFQITYEKIGILILQQPKLPKGPSANMMRTLSFYIGNDPYSLGQVLSI